MCQKAGFCESRISRYIALAISGESVKLRLRNNWILEDAEEEVTVKLTKRQIYQLMGVLEFGEKQNFPQSTFLTRWIARQAFNMSDEEQKLLIELDEDEYERSIP